MAMARECVLITGASTGIGKAFAKLFAKKNYDLVLVGLEAHLLKELAQELTHAYQVNVYPLAMDFSRFYAAEEVYKFILEKKIQIDILINNAGFGILGRFDQVKMEQIQAMMSVNMNAMVELTRLLLPSMLQNRKGKILNTASTAAFQPGPGMCIYFATKAFILSFSQGLASELERSGVTVTALCPGPTQTEFAKRAGMIGNRIHKGIVPIWSAEEVALYGYQALMKGKRLAIVGWINRICRYLSAWVPTRLVMNSVKRLHLGSS